MCKFKQLVEDILFKMSYERKELELRLSDQSSNITEHVIKILLFSKEQPVKHWVNEILTVCKYVGGSLRVKSSHRKLPIKYIRDWLFWTNIMNKEDFIAVSKLVIDQECNKYNNKKNLKAPKNINYDLLFNKYLNIVEQLCQIIYDRAYTLDNILNLFE